MLGSWAHRYRLHSPPPATLSRVSAAASPTWSHENTSLPLGRVQPGGARRACKQRQHTVQTDYLLEEENIGNDCGTLSDV